MNKYNPLVSIIIPVYNGSNYMREAIDSAINQTYDNIEIIVVNDGSTDNGETERIALSYGEKIKYYKKENGGCASALNFGISKMQGEWFSWLSHDDVYLPDKVKSAIDCINNNNLNDNTIVVCGSMVINKEGKQLPHKTSKKNPCIVSHNEMFARFMKGLSLNGCSLLIPKAALEKLGDFSTEYIYILDWIYWLDLSIAGYNFYMYPDILVKNRKHIDQVSVKKKQLLADETRKYILSLIETFKTDKKRIAIIWSYCFQIRMKQGCMNCEKYCKIPMSTKLTGIKRRFISMTIHFIRKILHI